MKNYFKDSEYSHSDTASRLGIDNTPSKRQYKLFHKLRDEVLNPTREFLGKPIKITSGYRCQLLNREVGGVDNSEHRARENSCACDIVCDNLLETFEWMVDNLEFNQCLLERIGGKKWIHVSYSTDKNKNYSSILKK